MRLALVWRFCNLKGGKVSVESELGKGATFSVMLPATVVNRPEEVAMPAA